MQMDDLEWKRCEICRQMPNSRLWRRREITVHRTFSDFDDFWMTKVKVPTLGPTVAAMASGDVETLKSRVRARLPQTPKDGSVIAPHF